MQNNNHQRIQIKNIKKYINNKKNLDMLVMVILVVDEKYEIQNKFIYLLKKQIKIWSLNKWKLKYLKLYS